MCTQVLSTRLGRKPEDIIKLDANENPYGPPPEVGHLYHFINMIILFPFLEVMSCYRKQFQKYNFNLCEIK